MKSVNLLSNDYAIDFCAVLSVNEWGLRKKPWLFSQPFRICSEINLNILLAFSSDILVIQTHSSIRDTIWPMLSSCALVFI